MGALENAIIKAYKDENDQNGQGEFSVLINTSTFKETYQIKYEEVNAQEPNAQSSKFVGLEPITFDIKILLDATGILDKGFLQSLSKSVSSFSDFLPTAENNDIEAQIQDFKDKFCTINESTHMPYELGFHWGKFDFRCVLNSLTIDYKIFDSNGNPVRAELTLNVTRKFPRIRLQSPDLTHLRKVKAGDNVQLLTNDIYGHPKHYWNLAKSNRLIHFRKLRPGEKLFFPPINKQ